MAEIDEEVLLKAIHSEIQARNAYELLGGRIEAEEGRAVMSALAKEEESHRVTLAARYRKLTGREYEFNPNIKAGPDLSFIKASVFKYTQALEALKLALGAEIDAIAFYQHELENATNRSDKGIFRTLLKYEKRHKKTLTKEITRMERSNHWSLPRE